MFRKTRFMAVAATFMAFSILAAWPAGGAASQDVAVPVSLKGAQGTLTLSERGVAFSPRVSACPAIAGQGGPLWSLTMQPQPFTLAAPVKSIMIEATGQKFRVETIADGFRLIYDGLGKGQQNWKIGLTLEFTRQGDGFQIGGELRNDEKGWLVRELTGPALAGIQGDPARYALLWPNGLGQRIMGGDRAAAYESLYPSRSGTMSWCAFAGDQGGLYLGCHDPRHGGKTLSAHYAPEGRQYNLSIHHQVYLAAGGRWELPPLVIRPYAGSWHQAARFYRAWYDSVMPLAQVPDWARGSSGWLLCILKQQNGLVMWDYSALGKLCDVADRRGLDILGLFGWARGGHDRFHPDTVPCPQMGGEAALRRALAEIHRRGKRVILYADGQLIDRQLDYWRTTGKDMAVVNEYGTPLGETWQKYKSFPAVKFDLVCLGARGWYERMLAIAHQAHDLGADGVLYDQLAVGGPRVCYAGNHGHPAPAVVYTMDRNALMRRVAGEMKKIDPQFILMTEGLNDLMLDSISIFHGCVPGVFPTSQAEIMARVKGTSTGFFPEMFRTTFPEVMTTDRNPTPMMDRLNVNYACVYGLRHELESRYAPDVRYLKEGIVPTSEDYRDNLYPPNVKSMRITPPDEAMRYIRQTIDFERVNADLLWRGRYVDDEGFKFEGQDMLAKAYAAGDRLGIVVWNPAQKAATFKLEVPGARLIRAAEPGKEEVEAFGALGPQSIRLLVWQNKGGGVHP